MSNFKIKHDKSKHMVQINTLDEKHQKQMVSFQNRRSMLPNKKRKIQVLQTQLNNLESINASKYTDIDIKKRAELKTEIIELEEEIFDIENDLSELDYYFKTEDIIMDYYQLTEQDDHIFYDDNPEMCKAKDTTNLDKEPDKLDLLNQMNKNNKKQQRVSKRRKKRVTQQNQFNILDFLSGNSTSDMSETNNMDKTVETNETTETTETNETTDSDMFINTESDMTDTEYSIKVIKVIKVVDSPTPIKNKAELLNQYMIMIDSEYVCERKQQEYNRIKKCDTCGIEKTLIHSDGMFVCQRCGEVEMIIIDSEKPNYKEAVSDNKAGYPYKRSNHLNEWLSQFQAKINYIEAIVLWLKKQTSLY